MLTEKEKEIMLITQEECAEVTQAISKIFRFGLLSQHNGRSNRERLAEEVGDLMCLIDLLIDTDMINEAEVLTAKHEKLLKLQRWSSIV